MKSLLGLIVVAGLAASANAQTFGGATTITDGASVFTLGNNLGGPLGNGPATSFSVTGPGGVNHAASTWWWVRVDGIDGRENAVFQPTAVVTNPAGNQIRIEYAYTQFSLVLQFSVSGFDFGFGSLQQFATIRNRSNNALTFNLFNYVDVNVEGTPNNDVAAVTGPNTVEFTDAFTTATYEASNALQVDASGNVLGLLTNGIVNNLTGGLLAGGPADLEIASQFQFTLQRNGVQSVSTTLTIIPTPGAAALLAIGGLVAARRRRA